MAKSAEARSTAIAYDGGAITMISTGVAAWGVAAVSNLGATVLPCDMRVGELSVRVIVAATSANALLNIGIQGDSDSNFDGKSFNAVAAGFYDLTNDAAWVSKVFKAGDVVSFELELATAVGSLAATLVLVPV